MSGLNLKSKNKAELIAMIEDMETNQTPVAVEEPSHSPNLDSVLDDLIARIGRLIPKSQDQLVRRQVIEIWDILKLIKARE